jgi:imidazolonepropionase-like amidohydrolase
VDVVVEAGRIVAVRDHSSHPDGVPVIDAAGRTVLPGLMENHAHHQGHDGEWVGRAWLAFGVTAVVEPGGLPYESRELRESWDSAVRPGPRLFMAGPQLDGERRYFPFASHILSEQRLLWEFERSRLLDYALIKTYTRMPPARQAEVIVRAHRQGLPVSSHEIYPALAMGGDRVEHLRGTSRAGFSSKQSDLLRSYADVTGLVGTPEAAISPTIVVSGGFFSYWLDHPELAQNRQYRHFYPDAYRNGLNAFAQLVGRRRPLLDAGSANARAAIAALNAAGARIVAGTDAPIFPYGLSLIIELASYVQAGLTPAQALRTATSQAADALGVGGEIGRIRQGQLADLLIVEGDPLAEITDLLRVSAVMRGGRYFLLEELLRGPVSP